MSGSLRPTGDAPGPGASRGKEPSRRIRENALIQVGSGGGAVPRRCSAWLYPPFPAACPFGRHREPVSAPPPDRTVRADFPHTALLHASHQGLCGVSNQERFLSQTSDSIVPV
jgi:hypothetical protein